MLNPLYFKISPDTNPSNVPNFQNVDKACQYRYSIFIIEENCFFSRTRNETINFVWTWCFSTDKHFWYNKSKKSSQNSTFEPKFNFSDQNLTLSSRNSSRAKLRVGSVQSGLYTCGIFIEVVCFQV